MVELDLTGQLPGGLTRVQLLKLTETALKTVRRRGAVRLTVAVVSDAAIKKLNKEYRGQDQVTDVLSFASRQDKRFVTASAGRPVDHLGDIIISRPQVKRQAHLVGRTMAQELALVFVHGLLHLLGYGHQTRQREETMFAWQQEIMMQAGIW